jgi:hypothetical protein
MSHNDEYAVAAGIRVTQTDSNFADLRRQLGSRASRAQPGGTQQNGKRKGNQSQRTSMRS